MTSSPGIPGAHRVDTVYDAVLFDMDGVVTDTAAIHAAAWKQLFDQVLQDPRLRVKDPAHRFDPIVDYRRYVMPVPASSWVSATSILPSAAAPGLDLLAVEEDLNRT